MGPSSVCFWYWAHISVVRVPCSPLISRQEDIWTFMIISLVFSSRLNISSVQSFSRIDSLQPHGLQHTRSPCPSPIPGTFSDPCPSSQWCHLTISSSVVPFSSCLQPFPASDLSQWVSSLHQVAKVLELRHQSFQWIFRVDFLYD